MLVDLDEKNKYNHPIYTIEGDPEVKRDAIGYPGSKKNTILSMSYTVTKINFTGIENVNMNKIF